MRKGTDRICGQRKVISALHRQSDKNLAKQTHNIATTSLQRRCNLTTLQRRCNDVVRTLCDCWDVHFESLDTLSNIFTDSEGLDQILRWASWSGPHCPIKQ